MPLSLSASGRLLARPKAAPPAPPPADGTVEEVVEVDDEDVAVGLDDGKREEQPPPRPQSPAPSVGRSLFPRPLEDGVFGTTEVRKMPPREGDNRAGEPVPRGAAALDRPNTGVDGIYGVQAALPRGPLYEEGSEYLLSSQGSLPVDKNMWELLMQRFVPGGSCGDSVVLWDEVKRFLLGTLELDDEVVARSCVLFGVSFPGDENAIGMPWKHFTAWFAGMRNPEEVFSFMLNLCQQPYFFGFQSAEQSWVVLRDKEMCSWLLRASLQPGSLAITVKTGRSECDHKRVFVDFNTDIGEIAAKLSLNATAAEIFSSPADTVQCIEDILNLGRQTSIFNMAGKQTVLLRPRPEQRWLPPAEAMVLAEQLDVRDFSSEDTEKRRARWQASFHFLYDTDQVTERDVFVSTASALARRRLGDEIPLVLAGVGRIGAGATLTAEAQRRHECLALIDLFDLCLSQLDRLQALITPSDSRHAAHDKTAYEPIGSLSPDQPPAPARLERLDSIQVPVRRKALPKLNKAVRRKLSKPSLRRVCLFETTLPHLESAILACVREYVDFVVDAPNWKPCCDNSPHVLPVSSVVEFAALLHDFERVVTDLARNPSAGMSDAVDLVDMALWRYGFGFKSRVSRECCDPVACEIQRESAREVWKRDWGSRYAVPFDDFFLKTVSSLKCPPELRDELHDFLQVALDFPADGFMTTYKFNILDQTLGPIDKLAVNFEAVIMARGFVGFINRARAWDMLEVRIRGSPDRVQYLIRYSRTEPTNLVATVLRKESGTQFDSFLIDPCPDNLSDEEASEYVESFVRESDLGAGAIPINARLDSMAVIKHYSELGSLFDPTYELTTVEVDGPPSEDMYRPFVPKE